MEITKTAEAERDLPIIFAQRKEEEFDFAKTIAVLMR